MTERLSLFAEQLSSMGLPFPSSLNPLSFHTPTYRSFAFPVIDAPKFSSVFSMPSPQEKWGHFHQPTVSSSLRNFRIRNRNINARFSSPNNPNSTPHASNGDSDPPANTKLIVVSSLIAVSLAIANRVLYKLALIPLKEYPFFLAQLTTFGFTSRSSNTYTQSGVAVAVGSGSNAGQMLSGVAPLWPMLMVASSACQAGASIMKEFIFIDAATRLDGKSLDIFVVNSFGSGFQALFVLLFLPFLSNLKGIPIAKLPSYLMHGAGCFLNVGAERTGCEGAPLLPLLYVITNLSFNITVLSVVKKFSAVVASLVVMLSVPVSIYILSLPLPYLPEGASLSPLFLTGSLMLVLGLVFYYIPQRSKEGTKID